MTTDFLPLTLAQLDEVLTIEAVSHHTPWTGGNFADSLASGHMATLLLVDGRVAAYAVVMLLPDEAELLNITVAPACRSQGLGQNLLDHVCVHAAAAGAQQMFLEVRASNLSARRLYCRSGFSEVGLRKGYYAALNNQREDAVLMAKELDA